MKALICDLCGAVVPDVPEADLIQNVVITKSRCGDTRRDFSTIFVVEHDMCLTCLEKLISGMNPMVFPSDLAQMVISAKLDSTQTTEPVAPKVAEIAQELIQLQLDNLAQLNSIAEQKIDDDFSPGVSEAIDFTLAMVKVKETHQPEPAPEPPLEVICQQCGEPFQARSERSRFCSKRCINQDKKMKQAKRAGTTDELLKKLKAENPITETKRPSIYYEM